MTRWVLVLAVLVVVGGTVTVAVARRLGQSGSRPSILVTVVAAWITAWSLWSMAGGLAARYGLLERYESGLFAVLAIAGGFWQYRVHVQRGRERGLAIFVGIQLVWLMVVMIRNGVLTP